MTRLGVAIFIFSISTNALAAISGLPFDPSQFSNPSSLITPDIANAVAKTAGILANHRPYEPATSLGTNAGVDLSIEATIFKTPDDFLAALTQAGISNTSGISFVPLAKFHLHKGISDRVEIGLSTIFYQGYYIVGGDLKITTYVPEEGPVWALRLAYSRGELGFVQTNTYTPALLVSQPLDFMEPYAGVALEVITGTIKIVLPAITLPDGSTFQLPTLTAKGSGTAADVFLGVAFRTPIGLKLTIEGSYNSSGADSLGLKFGFSF